MADTLKVTLVKSPISAKPKHRATVEALGDRKSTRQNSSHSRRSRMPSSA